MTCLSTSAGVWVGPIGMALVAMSLVACSRVGSDCAEPDRAESWDVVGSRLVVEATRLDVDEEFQIDIRNDSQRSRRIVVASISCGCISALDHEVEVQPAGQGRLRFKVRPKVLTPTEERIVLVDAESGTEKRSVLVAVSCRTGMHVTPGFVSLHQPLGRDMQRIAEMLIAVPGDSDPPHVTWRFLRAVDDAVEIVTDTPVLRGQSNGVTVYDVTVYAVGLDDSPRMVRECELSASWRGGAGSCRLTLTAAVDLVTR